MLLRQESCDGVDVLCASGPVDDREAQGLVSAVHEVLAHRPAGVVLDLSDVTALTGDARDRLGALTSLTGPARPGLVLCPAGVLPGVPSAESRAAAVARLERRSAPRTVIDVEHSANGPAQARAAVHDCAQVLGLDEVRDDVVLVVSEMVTNAVRHAAPPVRLELQPQSGEVVVAVRDGSPTPPAPRDADEDAEGGRGMLLVDMLTTDHGVRCDPPGKAVWARLRRSALGS